MPSFRLASFLGGLWLPGEGQSPATEQATFAIAPDALRVADNLDYLISGGIVGRRGARLVNESTQRGGPIQFIRRFVQRDRAGTIVASTAARPTFDLDATTGTVAWLNPASNDDQLGGFPQAVLAPSAKSHYLVKRGVFASRPIPGDAAITGLEINLIVYGSTQFGTKDYKVHLVNAAGVLPGQSATGQAFGVAFLGNPTLPVSVIYGGNGNTWGAGLTPALLNDPEFGLGFSVAQDPGGGSTFFARIISFKCFYTVPNTALVVTGYTAAAALTYELVDPATGAFTAIAGGVLTDPLIRPRAVFWPEQQNLYLFDGVNEPRQFDGTTMSALVADDDSELEVPKGPYVALHQGRLMVTSPGELQFSIYGSDINRPKIWSSDAQVSVNDDRGGKITGLISMGQVLLMLKDTSLWTMLGDIVYTAQVHQFADVGCVAPDTVARTSQGVIFLGRDGLKLTDGQQVIELSGPLRSLFAGRTADTVYTNAVGQWFPRRQQYWLKLDPTAAALYVLHRVRAPTGDRFAWSLIPAGPMNCAEVFELGIDDGDLYLADTNGFVWERDTGSDDAGLPYQTTLETFDKILDPTGRSLGRAYQVSPVYRGALQASFALAYDQNRADQLTFLCGAPTGGAPEYQEPQVFIADQLLLGRAVAFRIASTEAAQFEFHRVDMDVRMRGGRRWP